MPGIDRPAITDEQQKLADFVTQLLRSAGAVFRQTQLGGHEPWYRFVLAPTGDGNVSVSVHIAPDTFELNVNGADLRLARMDFAHGTEWVEACTHTLTQLAENDLTIRSRRTLFGKRVGAVQIPTGRGDNHWNGDVLACRGIGKLHTYADWLRSAPEHKHKR